MSRPSVADLVDAAARGDQAAWDQLVERFLPLVASVLRTCGLGEEDLSDVSQSVWLQLAEHLNAVDEPLAVPMWIIATARRESLRALRERSRAAMSGGHGNRYDAPGLDPAQLDDDLLRAERQHALREGLAELADDQRELLIMLVADPPVPPHEISRRLGVPVGEIPAARARSLRALRRRARING